MAAVYCDKSAVELLGLIQDDDPRTRQAALMMLVTFYPGVHRLFCEVLWALSNKDQVNTDQGTAGKTELIKQLVNAVKEAEAVR